MQFPSQWQQRKYDEVFESIRQYVRRRRAEDPQFTIESLTRLLESEYRCEGDDWIGRGSVQNIVHSATIAAYESALAEWQAE